MTIAKALCVATAAVLSTTCLQAQETFPKRTVTFVVPFAASGATDHLARVLGLKLSKMWGQAVVIENRAGGGTIIGTQLVSKAPADGYTLLFTSYGFTANSVLRKNLPYASNAFRPVARVATGYNVLMVTNRLKSKSLKELIADSKTKSGGLSISSSGLGSSPHIAAEFFSKLTGTNYTHVPYKGQGPAMVDLTAGVVDAMFDGMSSYSHVKSGYVGAVAIAAPQRHPDAPEIPTFKELGVDFVAGSWFGMLAPAGTPDSVVAKINADMQLALQDEEVKAQMVKTGASIGITSSEAFGQFLTQEAARLQNLVNQGAKIELN
ncbi:MAG: tripartite tricarboxylate transporter substrate binding protein [Comamonadaceae bacterium]|nr:tripartite tricarboxylate transporter substrate binding protein [Comamonadaceae bacterium]